MQHERTIAVGGNVVDMALSRHHDRIAYAMDTDHESFSQSRQVDERRRMERPSLGILHFLTTTGAWEKDSRLDEALAGAIREVPIDDGEKVVDEKATRGAVSVLYGLENLRKRDLDE